MPKLGGGYLEAYSMLKPSVLTTGLMEIPELKNEVQEIAKYQKAVLREVLHRLEKRCSFLHGEITGFSNSLSVCHPLDRGYLEDRLKEAIAKSTATHEAREMVWTILEELERLSEWHD